MQGRQPGQEVETYALLDNGSDVSLCDEKLIDELGISGVQRHFSLTTQEKRDSPRSGYEVKLIVTVKHSNLGFLVCFPLFSFNSLFFYFFLLFVGMLIFRFFVLLRNHLSSLFRINRT